MRCAARCCAALIRTQETFYQRSAATSIAAYVWTALCVFTIAQRTEQQRAAQQRAAQQRASQRMCERRCREVTFVSWTADELDAVEFVDAARLEDGEVLQLEVARAARLQCRAVPVRVGRTETRVVNVVEHAVLGHQQRVALERTHCHTHTRARTHTHTHTHTHSVS